MNKLILYFNGHGYENITIKNKKNIQILNNIIYRGQKKMRQDQNNSELMNCFGMICMIRCEYDKAYEYFMLAAENGQPDIVSMNRLVDKHIKDEDKQIKIHLSIINECNKLDWTSRLERDDRRPPRKSAKADFSRTCKRETEKFVIILLSMSNLRYLYRKRKIYDSEEKYGKMVLEKGSLVKFFDQRIARIMITTHHSLGNYYLEHQKYNDSIQHFLTAIENGYVRSMNDLGWVYYIQKDYKNAKKYYLMAIQNRNIDITDDEIGYYYAISNLAYLYYTQKDYENAEKYYLMDLQHCSMVIQNKNVGNIDYKKNYDCAICNLVRIYKENNSYDKILLMSKYGIYCNDIVTMILHHDITINEKIIAALHNYNIYNRDAIIHNAFTTEELYVYKVFKLLNMIPKVINYKNIETFEKMKNSVLLYRKYIKPQKIPKYLLLHICLKIFDE